MEIGYLLSKILQFYVFKMAANGGRHFEISMEVENYETQFISQNMHTHTFLTTASFVYYMYRKYLHS